MPHPAVSLPDVEPPILPVLLLDPLLAHSGSVGNALPWLGLDSERSGPAPSGVTVLVVDDNEQGRRITGRMLRDQGYAVIEVDCGEEALRVLAERPEIQVIVTDIVMPGGMDGLELAQRILAGAPWRSVVLMSGFPRGFSQLAESGVRIPILMKPFSAAQLGDQIREALQDKLN
jgi:CheY-like chemotaxis protein